MMTHTGSRNTEKALPADIRAAFDSTTYYNGVGVNRLKHNANVVQQGGGHPGMGDATSDATSLITAASDALAKVLAAQNPGTVYQGPTGTVYTQAAGVPVSPGTGQAIFGINGTGASAVGSSDTIMVVGLIGLAAVLLLKGKR